MRDARSWGATKHFEGENKVNALSLLFMYVWFFLSLWAICFRRRKFDSLSIYFVFLTLFFLPNFFGKVFDPINEEYINANSLIPVVNGLVYMGLLASLIWKTVSERGNKENFERAAAGTRIWRQDGYFSLFGLFLCICLAVLNISTLSQAENKVEVLEGAGASYILLTALVPVVFACAYSSRRWWIAVTALLVACLLFLFGSRRTLAILLLIWIYWRLHENPIVLAGKFKFVLIGLVLLFSVILGKSFYGYFLIYGWSGFGLWWTSLDARALSSGAEFLSTSAILHYVVGSDFSIPLWAVPAGFLSALPIPLSYFGISSSLFNDLFQGILFPGIGYEMAYNPWAEAYSWSGLVGVAMYSLLIPFALILLERNFQAARSYALSAILLTMVISLAFWVHRNSLGSELAYLRNIFFPSLGLYLVSMIFARVSLR